MASLLHRETCTARPNTVAEGRSMLIDANAARTRICRIAFAIAAVSLFAACGGDGGGGINTGPPPLAFTGTYALHSISDSLLPHVVPHPQFGNFRVDSGHMTLKSDMSYTYAAEGVLPGPQPATAADTGTFTESGSTISFTSKFLNGMIFTATASDTSLSVVLIGALLASRDNTIPVVFLKQR